MNPALTHSHSRKTSASTPSTFIDSPQARQSLISIWMRHGIRALALIIGILLPQFVSAQWVTESYTLKAGWNAIWLSQDCSIDGDNTPRPIKDVLPGDEIQEVWRWSPLVSTVQFTQSPSAPIAQDINWAVWRRGDANNSTLGTLTGNSAYLVKVKDGTPTFTLELTGKPLAPDYSFSSSGLNFIGFPMQVPASSTLRNFTSFFAYSSVLKSNPSVFRYNGGPLSNVSPQNPLQIYTQRSTPVVRGQAYWVNSTAYSDYYGPIKVTVRGSNGINFGRKLNTVTLRLENVTDPAKNQTVTARFELTASQPAPGGATPAELLNLRARGLRDSNLQFIYSDFDQPFELELAPGESKELVLDANRTQMLVADQRYEAILQLTDSLGQTRIDLPVRGIGSSRHGVWVGAAVLDSVNRVETISGPEFDAPLGTQDGVVPGETSLDTVTTTTNAGQTTQTTSFDLDFDSTGIADLPSAGMNWDNITLTSLTDSDTTPDFIQGAAYSITTSLNALVTNPGSGYTSPPTVRLQGGAIDSELEETTAAAVATLSASVRKVTLTDGGSGYRRQFLDVVFSGGGGTDAKGVAIVDSGIVTGVTLTDGGTSYTSAPSIVFPLPVGAGGVLATGTVTLTGDAVTGVAMNDGGSGYLPPIKITFSGDSISSAAGFAVVSSEGMITDVFLTNTGSGYSAPPSILISGGGGINATAISEIVGGIGSVTITDPGADYTLAPTVIFESADGQGSGAQATLSINENGLLTGVDRIQKTDNENGPIEVRARASYSIISPAAPGDRNGETVSEVLSTSEIVTLNGKSRVVTRRVSSGADAAAPSGFPIRLILHAAKSGATSLLQQIYLGQRDGVNYAGVAEATMAGVVTAPGETEAGELGRASSSSFPLEGKWIANSGSWGDGSLSFSVPLSFSDSSNPFVHAYHPDHDNWDARYERPLKNKQESHSVNREITFTFSSVPPEGVSGIGWGITTLGGFYTETFTGLRSQDISVSGQFIIHQVSEAESLTE